MAEISANLFAALSQEAQFLSKWRRKCVSKDGKQSTVEINLRDSFHCPFPTDPKFSDGEQLTNIKDIENFKQALFAFVMMLARCNCKQDGKPVTIGFQMTFDNPAFHPGEVDNLCEPMKNRFEHRSHEHDGRDCVFFEPKNPSDIDTIRIELNNGTASDIYVDNAIAHFQAGMSALACR